LSTHKASGFNLSAVKGLNHCFLCACGAAVQAAELEALQERLDSQAAAAKQAEDNARAAEKKAAEQATIAAAARAEVSTASRFGLCCQAMSGHGQGAAQPLRMHVHAGTQLQPHRCSSNLARCMSSAPLLV
jgi:hypothetical protein